MATPAKLKKTTTRAQQERLVDLLSTKLDIARNHTKRPAEEVAIFWQNVVDQVNELGPPVRDVNGWKKVWSDYKSYIKKKLADNKKEAGSTGGGPYNQKSFTDLEEAVISIVNLKDTIEGVGAMSFGIGPEKNSSTTLKPSHKSNDNQDSNELNDSQPTLEVTNDENCGYVSEASIGQSTKRKPLSTRQLLNKQVNFQEDYYKEISSMLNTTNKNLEDVVKHLKRVSRTLDNLCEIEKKKFKEMEEHNAELRSLMNRKLELKVQILEAELARTINALNE